METYYLFINFQYVIQRCGQYRALPLFSCLPKGWHFVTCDRPSEMDDSEHDRIIDACGFIPHWQKGRRVKTAFDCGVDECMDSDQVIDMLPKKKIVCPRCHGRGSHDPEAFEGGFTASEFDELFDTPEEKSDYFRGRYDVTCTVCAGANVVDDVDEDYLNDDEQIIFDYLVKLRNDEYYYEMEMEAERRMGC